MHGPERDPKHSVAPSRWGHSTKSEVCMPLDLGLPASRTLIKKVLSFISHPGSGLLIRQLKQMSTKPSLELQNSGTSKTWRLAHKSLEK